MADEEWSYSFSVADAAQPATIAPAIVTAVQTFHTTAPINAAALLKQVKVAAIGADGRYVSQQAVPTHVYTTPVAGTSSGSTPPNVALAVTLRGPFRSGPGAFGRFYLPLPQIAMDMATGQMTAGIAQDTANSAVTMLNAVRDALGGRLVIASQGGPTRAAQHYTVKSVEVGRVYDTQRRRRADLKEGFMKGTGFDQSGFGGAGGF